MLYQDFLDLFPPSNTGEFTEKDGDTLKVTWKQFKHINDSFISNSIEILINLCSLKLTFSIYNGNSIQKGQANVNNELIEFDDSHSEDIFKLFLEKLEFWVNVEDKFIVQ